MGSIMEEIQLMKGQLTKLLDDLMEDLNRLSASSAAVRSIRVVEGSE